MDFEWYLELLEQEDLAAICKWFNLPVQGFKNANKAPNSILFNVVKNSLVKGGTGNKTKRYKITFDVLLKRVALESSRSDNWSDLLFNDFLNKCQLLFQFKPFKAIAMLYHYYPEKYNDNETLLKENSKLSDKFIFYGFEGYEETTTISKMESLLEEVDISPYLCVEESQRYIELYCSPNEVTQYNEYKELISTLQINDDEKCLKLLYETAPKYRNIFLLAFLHINRLFDNDEYERITFFLENYLKYNYKKLSERRIKDEQLMKDQFKQDAEEILETLNNTKDEIELQKSQVLNKIAVINQNKTTISEFKTTIASFKVYADYFKNLEQKFENFLIVTGGDSNDLGAYLEKYVLSVKELNSIKKEKNIERLKDKKIFIARIAYSSSRKWNEIIHFLQHHNIHMIELDGYNEVEFLDQIIKSLSEEEKIYHDDYYN
jgi:hypothetical protein